MITVTDLAKEKIIDVLISEKSNVLRFGLQGGGCNGFQYYFSAEATQEEDDLVLPLDEGRILVVDSMSMMYLENAEIDYKKDIMGESFVFNNSSVKTSCGCGSSVGF